MRIAAAALLALTLSALPVPGGTAPGAAAQLPELEGEDVPRQVPLPPPPPAAEAGSRDGAESQAPGDSPDEPRATFGETLDVALSFHVVRVLRDDGAPVLGLGAADFRAIGEGGDPVRVVAADWYDSGATIDRWRTPPRSSSPGSDEPPPSPDAASPHTTAPAGAPLAKLPGKLVVVFVQADFNGRRIYGHLKQLPNVGALLETLAPRDRVAVVGFDSHMELWQDFTIDRQAARDAVWKAIHFGADPPEEGGERAATPDSPSLAAHLDPDAMADAAFAENALKLLGDALAAFPDDEKVVLFLGWGLGRYGFGGFRMRPDDYPQAVAALRRSNASVFVLDVMDAASHTLEIGLKQVAAQTGGVYVRTATNPMQSFRRVAQALSGYYLVSVGDTEPGAPVTFSVRGRERETRVLSHRVRQPRPPQQP